MTENIKIILASASPRRHELLNSAGISHTVFVPKADETPTGRCPDTEKYAVWYAKSASAVKCAAAVKELPECLKEGERVFVIGADTVVSPDMVAVYGKPKSREDAVNTVSAISGDIHYVVGGITVCDIKTGMYASRSVITEVKMKSLNLTDINSYADTDEPYDKAGSYGIQGIASMFVESISGDYANVVGLSVSVLADILCEDFAIELSELL